VIDFLDNDAAEHFVASVLAAQDEDREEVLATEIMATGAILAACGTVELMVARPTAYCKCVIVGKSRGASRGKFSAVTESWYKTERFGWFVHRRCNKPSRWIVWRWYKNMIVGHNDLLPELKAKLYPEPEESVEDREQRIAEERTQEELDAIREETDPTAWTRDTEDLKPL
jgi:hypothetical protein